jgi:magnesium and cobalt transporter
VKDEPPSSSGARSWLQRIGRVLGVEPRNRQQLIELLRRSESRHVINPDALAMMEGALVVSDLQVRDIMVPRAQVVSVEEDAAPESFVPTVMESGHSRFPVIDPKSDKVIGILLAKDLLAYFSSDSEQRFDMRDAMRPPVFVPESKRLNVLLREFRASRNHIAIVVDEYGSVSGVVTIEDVLEQIVGDIDDEHDIADEEYIRQYGDDHFVVRAWMPIEAFNEEFGTSLNEAEYDTIGGLVVNAFGHLPKRGESLNLNGFNFRVLRADRRRIRFLRVTRLADDSATADPASS